MATLGNSSAQTIGLITAGTEQLTHQAGKVAKGLRSIGINISNAAQKADTLAISVGGATQNIKLFNEAGEALGTFDVLSQIAQHWDEMSLSEQQAIGISLANKTQYEVFAAIMNQFDDAVSATNTAINSQGSAIRENEKYLESLEGRTKLLKSAFTEFILGDGGLQNFAKAIVDVGTAVLNFANSDLGKFVITIGVAMVAVKAFSALMKTEFMTNMITSVARFVTNFTAAMSMFIADLAAGELSLTNFKVVLESLTLSANPLILAIMGIVAAGFAIYKVATSIGERLSNLKDKIEENTATYEEQSNKIAELKKNLEELQRLKEQSEDTTQSEAEISGLQVEISLLESKNAILEQTIALEKEEAEAIAETTMAYGRSTSTDVISLLEAETERIAELRDEVLELNSAYKQGTISQDEWTSKTAKLESQLNEAVKTANNINDSMAETVESLDKESDTYERVSNAVNEYARVLTSAGQATQGLSDATESYKPYAKQASDATEELSDSADDATESMEEEANAVDQTSSAIEDSVNSIKDLTSAYDTIKSAVNEYNSSGKMNYETVLKLLELDEQYLSLLKIEDGQLKVNESAYKALIQAKIQEAQASYVAAAQAKIETAADNALKVSLDNVSGSASGASGSLASTGGTMNQVGNFAIQAAQKIAVLNQQLQILAKAKSAAQAAAPLTGGASLAIADAADKLSGSVKNSLSEIADAKKNLETVNELLNKIGDADFSGGSSSSGGGGGGGGGSSSSSKSKTSKRQKELEKVQKQLSKVTKAYEKQVKSLEKELSKLEKQYDKLKEKYVEQRDILKDYISEAKDFEVTLGKGLYSEDTSRWADIQDKTLRKLVKTYYQLTDAYEANREALINLYGDESAQYDALKKFRTMTAATYSDLQKAMETASSQGESDFTKYLNNSSDAYNSYVDEYNAKLKEQHDKEIALVKQTKAKTKAEKTKQAKEIAEIDAKYNDLYLNKYKQTATSVKDIAENTITDILNEVKQGNKTYSEALDELVDAWEEAKQAAIDVAVAQAEAQKTSATEVFDKQIQANKDYIDALNEQKEALERNNDELEDTIKLQQYLDNLAKAKAQKKMVYRANEGYVYESDSEAVASASKDLSVYKRELEFKKQKQAIDDQINELEKANGALEKQKSEVEEYWDRVIELAENGLDQYGNQLASLADIDKEFGDTTQQVANNILEGQQLIADADTQYNNQVEQIAAQTDAYIEYQQEQLQELKDAWTATKEVLKEKISDVKKHISNLKTQFKNYKKQVNNYIKQMKKARSEREAHLAFNKAMNVKMNEAYTEQNNNFQTFVNDFSKKVNNYASVVSSYEALAARMEQAAQRAAEAQAAAEAASKASNSNNNNNSNKSNTSSSKSSTSSSSSNSAAKSGSVINATTPIISSMSSGSSPSSWIPSKHAKGAYSIKDDELAIVGENEELVIGSKLNGGIPMSLKQGTGVLPNTFTETLTDMAKDYMHGKPNYTTNNNNQAQNISINNITLPSVSNGAQFIKYLQNFSTSMTQLAYS